MPHRLILHAGLVLCLALFATGCEHKSSGAPKKEAPATVPNIPKEEKLNEFELTPAAEERLGIVTAPLEKRPTVRMRMYGAEIALPTGASLVVTAPLAGFLESPPNGGIPKVGEPVKKGQPIFKLSPRLSADKDVRGPGERLNEVQARIALGQAQNDADAQVKQAIPLFDKAKLDLQRAERLQKNDAGTIRAVDDAKAALKVAEEVLNAALSRKKLVDGMRIDEEGGTLSPLVIEAPEDGIIRVSNAVAGQGVAAGAPLFEVMNASTVWVKVPVYEGELREIDASRPARISDLEDRVGKGAIDASPVDAPPTALALSSSTDLYYQIENKGHRFRPGQKVNASLPLREEREGLVIPFSAVEYDFNGGAWVYESLPEHKYVRHRVQVRYVVDKTAVLASGPPAGTKIVTEGVAELFGTEFGFGK